jgi:phosphatidylglycerol---prolipoprotein diacylglyceryl transferase
MAFGFIALALLVSSDANSASPYPSLIHTPATRASAERAVFLFAQMPKGQSKGQPKSQDEAELWIYYRKSGDGPFRRERMKPVTEGYSGSIPYRRVVEGALEYYLLALQPKDGVKKGAKTGAKGTATGSVKVVAAIGSKRKPYLVKVGPSAAHLPYLRIPEYNLFGFLPLQAFGLLVGLALVVGFLLGKRRARLTGLDPNIAGDGVVWAAVVGFVVAHLVSVVFYFPHRILENPWVLLAIWSGLSSFGGFLGGVIGAIWIFKRSGVPVLPYCDAVGFGLIPGWIFGRLGCTVVFDHPGKPTEFILGMMHPRYGVIHNLGLYEMLFTIFLTAVIYGLRNVRPIWGFHYVLVLYLYAPVRFAFDSFRVVDKKYFGFTPGQYFAVVMVLGATALLLHGMRERKKGNIPPKDPKPFVFPEPPVAAIDDKAA